MDASHSPPWVPYPLLGDSRRSRLGQAVQEVVEAWGGAWSDVASQLKVRVVEEKPTTTVPKPSALSVVATRLDGSPLLFVDAKLDDLATAMLGAVSSMGSRTPLADIARGVLEEALNALADRITALSGAQYLIGQASNAAHPAASRFTLVCVSLANSFDLIRVALAPDLVNHIVPAPSTRAAPVFLTGRRDAVVAQAVRLDVEVGKADVSLGDLAQLAVGHVLVLSRRLDEPCELRVRNRDVVTKVSLGRTPDDRYAARICNAPNLERST